MKKRICSILLVSAMICTTISGCGANADQSSSIVESIAQNTEGLEGEPFETETGQETEEPAIESESLNPDNIVSDDVIDSYSGTQDWSSAQTAGVSGDFIDLTSMGKDMVFATVFQMMMEPSQYTGKKIRMEGAFTSLHMDETNSDYYFVLIKDAMACCQQGMEFVWGDGSRKRSDYPEEGTDVLVEGVFETYREEGDDTLYCHIKDASMKII
ncbi:MAG: hypothetical protein K5641_07530 [Lachnospiraceae bacterium]|nr:hypothetical protein [Lachnospiraceae bacterium]